MKKKSGGQQGLRLNQEQKNFLQVMIIPLIVIILIVIIRIADQPEKEKTADETIGSSSPTVGELETGVTAAVLIDLEQERLPEEPVPEAVVSETPPAVQGDIWKAVRTFAAYTVSIAVLLPVFFFLAALWKKRKQWVRCRDAGRHA